MTATTHHPIFDHLLALSRQGSPYVRRPDVTVADLEAEFGPGSVREAASRHLYGRPGKMDVTLAIYRPSVTPANPARVTQVMPGDELPTDTVALRYPGA